MPPPGWRVPLNSGSHPPEVIAVTVMDEDAARVHDALIERGVTVFRAANP